MSRRMLFRILFLAVTAAAVGLELLAGFDGNPDTEPWTDLIVDGWPVELTFALIGALVLWLPVHFAIRYWRKDK